MTTDTYTETCKLIDSHGSDMGNIVEALMDRRGLAAVLQAIADTCNAKATHVEEAWQDKELAHNWLRCERRLDVAICEAKESGFDR